MPPYFVNVDLRHEVAPNVNVRLVCIAEGSPMPYVRWKLGDRELTPIDNIPLGQNVLVVNSGSESATYTCIAHSALSVVETDVEIKVA